MSGQFAVNIRAIQDVNPYNLESNFVTKAAKEPERDVETAAKARMSNDQGHETASCYSGKVQAELLFPLSEGEIKEDNCSSFVRAAYIGVYPTRDQVKITGRDDTFEYRHRTKFGGAAYCKHCGVHIYSNIYGPNPSIFDKLPPERREFALKVYHKNMSLQPVNVRSIESLDLSKIHVERSDEGTEGYVLED
ncbi:hypothetical protein VHEMI08526 [[Torrubiella] hemipterigena]|uniref:CENP-V/GFA domain-containing protein n=1 Tax=[Torrubiella] hemipterigena TaxID=1531966 RepID=A0A0A1TDS0_9HYPO|nr:hypothetical protein VHEMI08526 [[Torrubiella] hemipterigena]